MIATNFNMGPVINFVVERIGWVFTQLQNIEFLGTNMLAFWLTLSVIGVMLPILFTIAKGTTYKVGKGEIKGNDNRAK